MYFDFVSSLPFEFKEHTLCCSSAVVHHLILGPVPIFRSQHPTAIWGLVAPFWVMDIPSLQVILWSHRVSQESDPRTNLHQVLLYLDNAQGQYSNLWLIHYHPCLLLPCPIIFIFLKEYKLSSFTVSCTQPYKRLDGLKFFAYFLFSVPLNKTPYIPLTCFSLFLIVF